MDVLHGAIRWNGNVVLTTFSSLGATEVVTSTTDQSFVKIFILVLPNGEINSILLIRGDFLLVIPCDIHIWSTGYLEKFRVPFCIKLLNINQGIIYIPKQVMDVVSNDWIWGTCRGMNEERNHIVTHGKTYINHLCDRHRFTSVLNS